jgi:flagellar basal-body rod modification protein FlgD
MSTNSVWPYYTKGNLQTNAKKNVNEMGKDQFLHILMTQLKNQDPSKPLEDRDFIAQMAQFSSLEQMMNVGTEIKMLRQSLGLSSSLIGKQVSWNGIDEQSKQHTSKSGIVDAILIREGEQIAKIGNNEIPLGQIVKIETATTNVESGNP